MEDFEVESEKEALPPKVEMIYSAWVQFISFSQFTVTKAELDKENIDSM